MALWHKPSKSQSSTSMSRLARRCEPSPLPPFTATASSFTSKRHRRTTAPRTPSRSSPSVLGPRTPSVVVSARNVQSSTQILSQSQMCTVQAAEFLKVVPERRTPFDFAICTSRGRGLSILSARPSFLRRSQKRSHHPSPLPSITPSPVLSKPSHPMALTSAAG